MDDAEGGLSFDFEGGLDSGPTHPTASVPVIQPSAGAGTNPPFAAGANANNSSAAPVLAADGIPGAGGARRSFRQTVCRHWLRSLCMKGDACGFLHQYDKTRMPVCRFFRIYGECREPDCVYKHTNEDIKECNMFKLGFCPNGQDCRYRHAKLPAPPPPVEEVLQKIQQLTSFNYANSNRLFQNRNPNYAQQTEKSQFPQGANGVITVKTSGVDSGNGQQPQQVEQSPQGQIQNLADGPQNQASRSATPLPQGASRYFVVKSCNRENLELSVQQGVWATQRSNEAKLNEAFESAANVILIFSVNKTRNFQGCAKMTTKIGGSVGGGNWKHAHGTAHYGRNFDLKWLKLCELSFQKTRHLRNPYNENLPVKISRDCQELEPSIGEQLASLLYLEPDSELMAIAVEAESKREEEKAKGVQHMNNGKENPDIVPFEDNEEEEEEEEEEESEEEDENQTFGPQGRGRGGGRGNNNMMWPPHMMPPFPRGLPRPFPGMHGFPPNMMDGFPMQPDMFGMPPRGFGPYGPRFPGPMFPAGRPGGFGMLMGPGRAPFIGRGGARPHPFYPPQRPRRDQNEAAKSQQQVGGDEGRYQKVGQKEDHYSHTRNNNDSEESEDEAPRRSRHGEGKKKRRGSDMDSATASGDN